MSGDYLSMRGNSSILKPGRNPFYLLENQITKFLFKSTGEYWIDKLRIFFPLPLVALSGFPWSSTFTSLLTLHPMSASFPFLASLAAPKLHRPRATTLRVRQSMRQDVLSCFISCWICAPRITNWRALLKYVELFHHLLYPHRKKLNK